ncbi:hypothetical protein [Geobacillus thermodenitrificans]|uniref:hypothetical protein n=1 Tax=Geobacillus thermodenitrificans TaxID=33940 RepID=UPI0035B53E3E
MKTEENKAVDAKTPAAELEANAMEDATTEVTGHNDMEAASEAPHIPGGEETHEDQEHDPLPPPVYVKAANVTDLFERLINTWIAINRGGPEAVEGILVPGGSGYCTIVNHDEIIRVNYEHIKSISCGPKGAFQANTMNAGDGKETGQAEAKQEPNQAEREAKKAQKKEEEGVKAKQKEQGDKKKRRAKRRRKSKATRKKKRKRKKKRRKRRRKKKKRRRKRKRKKDDEGGKRKRER